MLEQRGDLWTFADAGHWVAITTNGDVVSSGRAVMGKGVAKDAARRIPGLPLMLGAQLRRYGNHVHVFSVEQLLTFPTKRTWREVSDLALIARSANELVEMVDKWNLSRVYLPRPGCGAGHRAWAEVKPLLAPVLDDRFIVLVPLFDHFFR